MPCPGLDSPLQAPFPGAVRAILSEEVRGSFSRPLPPGYTLVDAVEEEDGVFTGGDGGVRDGLDIITYNMINK